jgi:hypothetical protein
LGDDNLGLTNEEVFKIIGAKIISIEFNNSGDKIEEIHIKTRNGEHLIIIGGACETLEVLNK